MAALQYVIKVIECDSEFVATPVLERLEDFNNELEVFLKENTKRSYR